MSQSFRQQRTYEAEFKRDAVQLVVDKGRSCTDVAEALGIPVGTLYNWVEAYKKHRVDPFPGKGKLHADEEELHHLRRKVSELEEENEILKKPQPSLHNSRREIPDDPSISGRVSLGKDV